ncbi:hypothetical protein UlMin_024910 [Ulmus minor]
MTNKSELILQPAKDLGRMTLNSGESSHISVLKTEKSRRRRFKVRQLDYTCRAKIHVSISGEGDFGERKKQSEARDGDFRDPVEIKVSITSSENNVVVSSFRSKTREGNTTRDKYGVVSVIGGRKEMEDAVRAELGFAVKGREKFDFFGVYDGHGGSRVAKACRERLHEVVAMELKGVGELEWEKVMDGCFGKMDDEVNGDAAAKTVGATALVALVAEEELVIANCGDCRAVMSRDGVALALSCDHKPQRPDELKRIEAAGGRVIHWNGHRVLGVLGTSRSIGDRYLRPFVISKPEVTVTKRSEKDEFLILGSDGLWDVVSNEVACKVVKRCLDGKMRRLSSRSPEEEEVKCESRTSEAAAVLAELAMARGSKDNISVIVVDLMQS